MITLNWPQAYCPVYKKSLQKEQHYKRWKSISSIYRRHPHYKTNIHWHPLTSLTGNTLHRTTSYIQKQTDDSTGDRGIDWSLTRQDTHTTRPTGNPDQGIQPGDTNDPTKKFTLKSYFCKLAMDSLASSSTWSCIWRIYISWDLWPLL